MATQTQQFSLPTVSFEGAGKLYEALAANASSMSQAAGRDAQTALAESRAGFSRFQGMFNASEASRARGIAELSSANNMLRQSGNRVTQRAIATELYNAQQYRTVIQSVNQLVKAGASYKAADTKAQTVQGMIDGKRAADELKTLMQTDPYSAKDGVEQFLNQYSADPENPYLKGMAVYMFPTYDTTSAAARRETFNTNLTSYAALIGEAKFSNNNTVPKGARENYAKEHDMPVAALRDVEYSTFAGITAQKVLEAKTPFEEQQVLQQWEDDKKKNYGNTYFIGSKSRETKAMITKADSAINAAMVQKRKEFKQQGEQLWVKVINDPLNADEKDISSAMELMSPNPREANSLTEQFTKKYKQANIDKQFTDNFTPTTMMSSQFWSSISPELKSQAEQDIGKIGLGAFLGKTPGELEQFRTIMQAQRGHVKGIGESIYNLFTFGSPAQKQIVYDKLNSYLMSSDLSPYLSQMMGDKELSKIILAGTIVQAKGGITEDQIAKNWEGALSLVSQPESETKRITPLTDKDLYNDVADIAEDLGDVEGRYWNVMNSLFSKNRDVANDLVDKVGTYFENLKTRESYDGPASEKEYDVQEYTTHSPDPFADDKLGIDEDYRDEVKGRLLDNLTVQFAQQGKDTDIGSLTYLPDDFVLVKNSWGYPIDTVPIKKFLEEEREAIEIKKHTEQSFFENWGLELQTALGDISKGISAMGNKDTRDSVLNDLANMIGGD